MNEKQFNHIENKIKEAADSQETPFDELSWKKMEALLDENKDRKRPFFWIFIPLLAVILVAGYYFYAKTTEVKPGEKTSALSSNQIKAQVKLNEEEIRFSRETEKKDISGEQGTSVDKIEIQNNNSQHAIPEKLSGPTAAMTAKNTSVK